MLQCGTFILKYNQSNSLKHENCFTSPTLIIMKTGMNGEHGISFLTGEIIGDDILA